VDLEKQKSKVSQKSAFVPLFKIKNVKTKSNTSILSNMLITINYSR